MGLSHALHVFLSGLNAAVFRKPTIGDSRSRLYTSDGIVGMDVSLDLRPPVARPVSRELLVVDVGPVAKAHGEQDLFTECRQFMEVGDSNIAPMLPPLHVIHRAHPGLRIRHHGTAAQELLNFLSGKQPLHDQHFAASGPGQITKLVSRLISSRK